MQNKTVTISQEDGAQFKKDIISSYKMKLYTLQAEQRSNVDTLIATREVDEKNIETYKEKITELTTALNKIPKKKDKVNRNAAQKISNQIAATQFIMTRLQVERSDAYKGIVERAGKIQDIIEWISFYEDFDGAVPRLPFIEIEGTRYASTVMNEIQLDLSGNKVLYVENEDKKTKSEAAE